MTLQSVPRDSVTPDIQAPRLRRLQRWMQSTILAPGSAEDAVNHPEATKEVPAAEAHGLIRRSAALAPLQRLDIYRGMYRARVLSTLRVDYPELAAHLGDDQFRELAELYTRQYPSTAYTLNRFGDHLPEFIQRVQGLTKPGFVRDLARFELARTEVFDEAECGTAGPADIAAISPDHWEQLRLRPIAALRLLRLGYPVHEFVDQRQREPATVPPRRRLTHLVVYRRDYAVIHLRLTAPAFTLLDSLAQGELLGESLRRMFAAGGCSEKDVFRWFQCWFSERLFANVGFP